MGGTVWHTAGNRFLVPSKHAQVVVKCGGARVLLAEWQQVYGQDPGASVGELPPIPALMDEARAKLGLPSQ